MTFALIALYIATGCYMSYSKLMAFAAHLDSQEPEDEAPDDMPLWADWLITVGLVLLIGVTYVLLALLCPAWELVSVLFKKGGCK